MMMNLRFGAVAAAVTVLVALSSPATADRDLPGRQCTARFTCSFGDDPQCFFRIITASGSRVITVPAGESRTIFGLRRGDVFCENERRIPPPNCWGRARDIRMTCRFR